jgi:hypothetical protein
MIRNPAQEGARSSSWYTKPTAVSSLDAMPTRRQLLNYHSGLA